MKWLVFWCKGGRIGSVALTDESRKEAHRAFCMDIIQVDDSGTEHWNVLGVEK